VLILRAFRPLASTAMASSVALVLLLFVLEWASPLGAQEPMDVLSGRYAIVEGSTITEDCSPCAQPPVTTSVRGAFWLRAGTNDAPCVRYLIQDLVFASEGELPLSIRAKGHGTYRDVAGTFVNGEFVDGTPRLEEMRLYVSLNAKQGVSFQSGLVPAQASPPWIEIDLAGTPPDVVWNTTRWRLHLVAVRWPRFLFSTEVGLTSGQGGDLRQVSDGDLLGSAGDVVLTNAELTQKLGIKLPVPDLGLDGALLFVIPAPVGPVPSPEIQFTTTTDAFSETLGPLGHGDILLDSGAIFRKNADLLRPFSPMPPLRDVGLDALCTGPDGSLCFSTKAEFLSETLGRRVRPGDLLSSDGHVFRSQEALLARFRPANPAGGPVAIELAVGLDAAYVWPHGEVWFSTEMPFVDERLGPIGSGDILSDTGRVVARNRDLVRPFQPVEDLADFGLDALVLDLSAGFDACGVLVDGVECVLFRADTGEVYVISNRGTFVPGDRVRVTGYIFSPPCATRCQEGSGCILGNTIEACPFEGCGRIAEGPDACVVFEADAGGRYVLDDFGGFGVGDRVYVTGRVAQGCNSICVTPCVAILENTVEPCSLDACGRLVDVGDGCIVFENAAGERYIVENVDGYAPGDAVRVEGAFVGECDSPCADRIPNDGCIQGNVIDSLGSIGEVGFFRRADCNGDGKWDIADAVFSLLFLFSTGDAPGCRESCNSNADASVDVADPVHTLNYLFLGGPQPPTPFPECEWTELEVQCGANPCPCDYPDTSCGPGGGGM